MSLTPDNFDERSTEDLIDTLSRYREFEGFVNSALCGRRDVAEMWESASAENARYDELVGGFADAVGRFVKPARHPYPQPVEELRQLVEEFEGDGLSFCRVVETEGRGLTATVHLSCELFPQPTMEQGAGRLPGSLFEAMDDLHPVGSAFVSDHEAERIEGARRIVLLRSALYLSVPCGEYVVFRRLMALEHSASPDRRLGLPRWALRALFGIRSKVVAEMEGNALVVSTVLSAEFE